MITPIRSLYLLDIAEKYIAPPIAIENTTAANIYSLLFGYSCAGVPLFRRNGYRQSSGRKPLFRNRDTALN